MSSKKKEGSGSHKSFQPVLPCGNKVLQKKWDATYYNEHKKLIKSAKSMVDTKAPPKRPHMTSKKKKQQMEKERLDEIDRDNINLLKKMERIMDTEGGVDHRNSYRHHSLNQLKRGRELERVAAENRQMLKRLQGVEPTYKMSDWIDDWHKKGLLTEMISSYPGGPPIPVVEKISSKSMEDTGPVDVIEDCDNNISKDSDHVTKDSDYVPKDSDYVPKDSEEETVPGQLKDQTPTSPVDAGKEVPTSPVEAGKEAPTSPVEAEKETPTSPVKAMDS